MHITRFARAVTAAVLSTAGVLTVPNTVGAVPSVAGAGTAGVAPDVLAAASGLLAQNPAIGLGEAVRRIDEGPARLRVIRQAVARHQETFGGAWYDPVTGIQHRRATTTAAARDIAGDAARAGVAAELHPAEYSYRRLSREAERINSGTDPVFGAAGRGKAFIDTRANRTVVALPPTAVRTAAVPAGPVLLGAAPPSSVKDACTSYRSCGIPMRSGIALQSSNGPCSVGFTATAADTSHWVLTAGHCAPQGTNFWHGEQDIGPMRLKTEDDIDVGRIRIDSSYWKAGSFGWLYNVSAPNSPVPLNDYADTLPELQVGEYVCLLARYSTSGNVCGPITTVHPYQTWVAVDACDGDSGGGWYLPGGGNRTAYGIHGGSTDGCHTAGGSSYFSPVPTVHRWLDGTSAARIRIDVR